jgi:hypothetical protein
MSNITRISWRAAYKLLSLPKGKQPDEKFLQENNVSLQEIQEAIKKSSKREIALFRKLLKSLGPSKENI